MSNALMYLMAKAGHFLLAYLDDYISCNNCLTKATSAYEYFVDLAANLGLQLAVHKCVKPTTRIDCLGYTVDTKLMTVAVPQDKLAEVLQECKRWEKRSCESKKMIQSIAGHLMYISNCIRSARKFTARVLSTLRNMKDKEWTTINKDFAADLRWFYNFAAISNGIYYYTTLRPEVPMECDSSLPGPWPLLLLDLLC